MRARHYRGAAVQAQVTANQQQQSLAATAKPRLREEKGFSSNAPAVLRDVLEVNEHLDIMGWRWALKPIGRRPVAMPA